MRFDDDVTKRIIEHCSLRDQLRLRLISKKFDSMCLQCLSERQNALLFEERISYIILPELIKFLSSAAEISIESPSDRRSLGRFPAMLRNQLSQFKPLRRLTVYCYGKDANHLIDAFPSFPPQVLLLFRVASIPETMQSSLINWSRVISNLLEPTSKISELMLSNLYVDNTVIELLVYIIKRSTSIKSLGINNANLGDNLGCRLLSPLPEPNKLERLVLRNDNLGDSFISQLCIHLRNVVNLYEVNLSGNVLSVSSFENLLYCLLHKCSIRRLILKDCSLSNAHLTTFLDLIFDCNIEQYLLFQVSNNNHNTTNLDFSTKELFLEELDIRNNNFTVQFLYILETFAEKFNFKILFDSPNKIQMNMI
eukprot:TRINITY_DN1100_c0_g1_i1.p1 TRINITY_DN1100_c0_g1~~TRINITY_DN1100_c0_g1_i1.p1  ORF type:complete len:366 (+),score=87.46 TRINITY_DN1100_c0_g1_i1:57-1154(+)